MVSKLMVAAVGLVLCGGTALAHEGMTGAAAARGAGMKAIGAANKGIFDSLNKGDDGKADVQANAATLAALAPQTAKWFPKGSGPEGGGKTHAKPDIWLKPAEFEAKRKAFVAQAVKLNAVAKGGDMAATRAEFMALRGTCKSCHDQFKADD
ncbi:MAG: c-type cytochrome [Caulobacteraceae bacterium]